MSAASRLTDQSPKAAMGLRIFRKRMPRHYGVNEEQSGPSLRLVRSARCEIRAAACLAKGALPDSKSGIRSVERPRETLAIKPEVTNQLAPSTDDAFHSRASFVSHRREF
jgi:hypothetical protein